MRLQVSTEVEPAVFDEPAALAALDARVIHRVHKGWLSLEVDSGRVGEVARIPGVLGTLIVPSCDDHLDRLPAELQWSALKEADCHALVAFRLEQGTQGARTVALRLTAEVKATCLVRSHITAGMDIVLWRADPAAPGGRRVLARHTDGLRDRSAGGMHNWRQGQTHTITMWVGHLAAGEAEVEAGLVGGWIRVGPKPTPFTFTAPLTLGDRLDATAAPPAAGAPAAAPADAERDTAPATP